MRHALVLLAVLIAPVAARAALPAARNPNAMTDHAYRAALLDYNRRTIVEMYKSIGTRDARWDAQAVAFMDAFCVNLTYRTIEQLYQKVPVPSLEELDRLGQAARDAGCEDPMVLYCHAAILNARHGAREDAVQLTERASNAILSSRYPVVRAADAARFLYVRTDAKDKAKREAAWQRFQDLALTTVATWDYRGHELDRRAIVRDLYLGMRDGEPHLQRAFARALESTDGADKWVSHVLQGRCDIEAAREWLRGPTSTTRSDTAVRHLLDSATEHFEAAWALEPTYPEPAADMITVALWAKVRDPGRTPRYWYERATSAQFDFRSAHDQYLLATSPRWGGSIEQMYAYGVECIMTDRFDTRVPEQFFVAMRSAHPEHRSARFWLQPGAYRFVARLCDGLVKRDDASRADEYRSFQAAVAWKTEQYPAAVTLFEQLGDRVQSKPFKDVWGLHTLAISQSYALAAANVPDAVERAEKLTGEKEYDAAIDAYAGALSSLAPKHKGRPFLQGRIQQLEWQKQFDAGGWVDILPAKRFVGWHVLAGDWAIDNGALVGTYTADGLALMCEGAFWGKEYVIEAAIELPDGAGDAGLAIAPGDPTTFDGFWLRGGGAAGGSAGGAKSLLVRDYRRGREDPVELKPNNVLRLTFDAGELTAHLNDNAVFAGADVTWAFHTMRTYMGIGGRTAKPGTKVRFTSLRVQRLDEPVAQ